MSQSKRAKDRYHIKLDSGQSLLVSVAHISDYSLYTGRELSEEELKELSEAVAKSSAKDRAFRIISNRNMSHDEMRKRLIEKGETPEVAEETADWLEDIGILNDTEYAGMIVRHYTARGYGAGKVKNELFRRGVDRSLWEDALEQIPENSDAIDKFIAARLKNGKPDRAETKKVSDALFRRGFSWDEIRSALSRYSENFEE